jgi:hypothetical protein
MLRSVVGNPLSGDRPRIMVEGAGMFGDRPS